MTHEVLVYDLYNAYLSIMWFIDANAIEIFKRD